MPFNHKLWLGEWQLSQDQRILGHSWWVIRSLVPMNSSSGNSKSREVKGVLPTLVMVLMCLPRRDASTDLQHALPGPPCDFMWSGPYAKYWPQPFKAKMIRLAARHGWYDSESNHEATQNLMFFAWVMSWFESKNGESLWVMSQSESIPGEST